MIWPLKKTGNCLRAIVGNASRTASSNIGKVMTPHRRKMTQRNRMLRKCPSSPRRHLVLWIRLQIRDPEWITKTFQFSMLAGSISAWHWREHWTQAPWNFTCNGTLHKSVQDNLNRIKMPFFLQIVLNCVSPIGQSSVLESPSGNHGKRMKGLQAAYALQASGGKVGNPYLQFLQWLWTSRQIITFNRHIDEDWKSRKVGWKVIFDCPRNSGMESRQWKWYCFAGCELGRGQSFCKKLCLPFIRNPDSVHLP
jgi:hypothetical protein